MVAKVHKDGSTTISKWVCGLPEASEMTKIGRIGKSVTESDESHEPRTYTKERTLFSFHLFYSPIPVPVIH